MFANAKPGLVCLPDDLAPLLLPLLFSPILPTPTPQFLMHPMSTNILTILANFPDSIIPFL